MLDSKPFFLSVFPKGASAAVANHSQVQASWSEVLELVQTHTVCPIKFSHTGTKSKVDAIHLESFIGLDIDGGLTLKEAEQILDSLPYAYILGTTRNHQRVKVSKSGKERKEACDRFRVYLPIKSPADEYHWGLMQYALNDLFQNSIDADCSYTQVFFPITVTKNREPRSESHYYSVPDPSALKFEPSFSVDWARYSVSGLMPGNSRRVNGRQIGCISKKTRDFVDGKAWKSGDPGWHGLRISAAGDLRDQGYTEAEARELMSRATGKLDDDDLFHIADMYKRPKIRALRLWRERGAGGDGGFLVGKQGIASPAQLKEPKVSDNLLAATVTRFMENEYLQAVMQTETLYYEVRDSTDRQVELVTNEHRLERKFAEKISLLENQEHVDPKTGEVFKKALTVTQARKLWNLYGPTLEDLPAPFGFRGDKGWVLKRLNFDLSTPGEYPAWREFLGRLSDPGLFMAWVYSIFDSKNRGRQALWLYGPHGRDGKTRVINALSDVMGGAAAGIQGTNLKNTQFFLSQLFGRRLVTYSDCKLPHFVKEEIFRNLTGGDRVSIEFKNKTPFSAELYTKLLIASNQRPATSYEGADLSRLIVIEVKPSPVKDDADWVDRLKDEMPFFLNACHKEYEDRLFRGGKWKHDFILGEVSEAILERSKDQASSALSYWFEKFEIDTDRSKDWISQSKLYSVCVATSGGEKGMTENMLTEFIKYLEKQHGVDLITVGKSKIFRGLCLKSGGEF